MIYIILNGIAKGRIIKSTILFLTVKSGYKSREKILEIPILDRLEHCIFEYLIDPIIITQICMC